MQQKIYDRQRLNSCYKINKQFIHCLDDIFKKINPNVKYDISIQCKKATSYEFSDLNEFFEFAETLLLKISGIGFNAHFPINENYYSTNNVKISLFNEPDKAYAGEITYSFFDENSYLIIKDRLSSLFRNYKLSYAVVSRLPIIPLINISVFIGICIYTNCKGIIYPHQLQNFIVFSFIAIFFIAFSNPVCKLKRQIFPINEFRFGANVNISERVSSIRNLIGISVILSLIIGITVNFISSFLFK